MSAQVNGKRMAGGVMSVLLLFLLVGVGKTVVEDPPAGGDPTTTTVPTACPTQVHYYRHDLPAEVNHFGPAAPDNDVNAALAEQHKRRCTDAAQTVGHRQYSQRHYTSPEERLAQTEGLVRDPQAWALNVLALEEREATAVKTEILVMTEPYQTLYMVDTPVPIIYQDIVDRPSYKVLRFTYADGSMDNYKLDCGFQPVEPIFPGIPGPPAPQKGGKVTPSGPTPTVAPRPPTTCDPRVCKGPDRAPAPCRTSDGIDCSGPGAGGQPGTGGASNHGSDGYSPQDPAPPPIVTTVKPPSSTTMLPPTTAPPTTVLPKPVG